LMKKVMVGVTLNSVQRTPSENAELSTLNLQPSTFDSRGKNNIPVINRPVVALDKQWPRLTLITIECATSNSRYFLVTNDRLAVCHNSNHSSHEGNIICLPF